MRWICVLRYVLFYLVSQSPTDCFVNGCRCHHPNPQTWWIFWKSRPFCSLSLFSFPKWYFFPYWNLWSLVQKKKEISGAIPFLHSPASVNWKEQLLVSLATTEPSLGSEGTAARVSPASLHPRLPPPHPLLLPTFTYGTAHPLHFPCFEEHFEDLFSLIHVPFSDALIWFDAWMYFGGCWVDADEDSQD